jgi:hypothetical protein
MLGRRELDPARSLRSRFVRVAESGRYLMKASEKIVPIATARDFAVSCCKLFGLLSGLNGLFWFLADFGKFTPPSEGIFLERLLYFLVAELGPIAISLSSVPLSGQWWWLGLPSGLITFGLFFPDNGFARFSGFSGVFLWLFFGFAIAAIRIT